MRRTAPVTSLTPEQWALVVQFLPLVAHIIRYRFRVTRRDRLYQTVSDAAHDALFKAAAYYDSGRGVQFKTYAYTSIWRGVARALTAQTRAGRDKFRQFGTRSDGTDRAEFVPGREEFDHDAPLESARRAAAVKDALRSLNETDRLIVTRRFGLDGAGPRKLREISAEVGITKERIRQRLLRASERLRDHCAAERFR